MPLQHLFSENISEALCGWLAAVQIGGRKLGEREREREREGGRSWLLLQTMNFAAEIVSLLAGWMGWVDGCFFSCLRACHRSAASGWDEEGRFPGSRTWTQGPTSCMG